MHHLGLDPFSNPGEHWILQASLTHSISDELFVLSFASVLDASALASGDLRAIGFVGGKIGSVFLGRNFRSPRIQREREQEAQQIATSFLLSIMRVGHTSCRIMLSMQAVKEMDLRGRLLIC